MLQKKRIIYYLICAAALILCVSIIAVNFSNDNKEYVFSEHQGLRLLSCKSLTLSDTQKDEINKYLDTVYIENDKLCGFISEDMCQVNWYKAYNCLRLAERLNDNNLLEKFKIHMNFISEVNGYEDSITDLAYYYYICCSINSEIDSEKIQSSLLNFYDSENKLFFLTSKKDSVSSKCAISAFVIQIFGNEIIGKYKDEMKEAAKLILSNFTFTTDTDKTFYNSGASVLYYCSVLGLEQLIPTEQLKDWFAFWEKIHTPDSIKSVSSGLYYSEFLNIAKLFNPEYSTEIMDSYYCSLIQADAKSINDFQMVNSLLKHVDDLSNDSFNNAVLEEISELFESGELIYTSIDTRSTAFALSLAYWSDFNYNKEKLGKFISGKADSLSGEEANYQTITLLYYLLWCDQSVNNYSGVGLSETVIQRLVNEAVEDLSFSNDSMNTDIEISRMILEIVSDIQIFNNNVNLNNKQVRKITNGVKKAVLNDNYDNSLMIYNIVIIQDILGLDYLSEPKIIELYHSFKTDDGIAYSRDSMQLPDILSLFLYRKTAENHKNIETNDFFRTSAEFYRKGTYYSLFKETEKISIETVYIGYYLNYTSDFGVSKK